MVEPTSHCPYLGLKQNRAIRFATPTSEHRCYVSGEALDIPVDQASYCLAQDHIHCPLYMGLSVPTMPNDAPNTHEEAVPVASTGIHAWFASLSPRDRTIYAIMLGMLALIIAIYLLAGIRTFMSPSNTATAPSATSTPVGGLVGELVEITPSPTLQQTSEQNTPLPTSTPTQEAAQATATQNVVLFPTVQPSPMPTIAFATATAEPTPEPVPPTAPPIVEPTSAPPTPTNVPPVVVPSSVPVVPQASPTPVPLTAVPPTSIPPTATTEPMVASQQRLTLYFADASGTMYVPVQRQVTVYNNRVALAAVQALIDGPRNGLQRLLLSETKILDLTINNGTATVNFDRYPSGQGDNRGLLSVMYTLVEFPSVSRVQIQVNGQNVGIDGSGPIAWRPINLLNPEGLAVDYGQAAFLPIYFVANNGIHDVRIIRLVPKTNEVAQATVRAILAGPGQYADRVWNPIPSGTELRGIKKQGSTIIVDFTKPFADAPNRDIAIRTVVASLTSISGVDGVIFLVEGSSLADQWGGNYGGTFTRRTINAE